MNQKTVYILHKNGANNHYTALKFLLQKQNIDLQYREFSVISKSFKSITKFDGKLFYKQMINAAFLIGLLFSKNKKIVLGIAPFDSKLGSLLKYLKNHQVYYHTSWTYWDKSFHPKTKKNTPKVFNIWKDFIENKALHIFAVTQQTKNQLLQNYKVDESKINIVYHSMDEAFTKKVEPNRIRNSFIYLGRLVPQKGIEEIIDFFTKNTNYQITIIGNGKLKELVEKCASKYKNISYKNHTNNKEALTKELSQHEYVLLNSKKNKKWEELFGLIIIESMAQGLIPIAPNHSGPKEIISDDIGYIFKEGDLHEALDQITAITTFDNTKSDNARKKSEFYLPQNIANNWRPILN